MLSSASAKKGLQILAHGKTLASVSYRNTNLFSARALSCAFDRRCWSKTSKPVPCWYETRCEIIENGSVRQQITSNTNFLLPKPSANFYQGQLFPRYFGSSSSSRGNKDDDDPPPETSDDGYVTQNEGKRKDCHGQAWLSPQLLFPQNVILSCG